MRAVKRQGYSSCRHAEIAALILPDEGFRQPRKPGAGGPEVCRGQRPPVVVTALTTLYALGPGHCILLNFNRYMLILRWCGIGTHLYTVWLLDYAAREVPATQIHMP